MAGRSSTARQRAARTRRIVAAAEQGDTAERIAKREGVSARTVRRVLAAEPSASSVDGPQPAMDVAVREPDDSAGPLSIDPFAIRREVVRTHVESLATLRTLARDAQQPAVRCGAARAAVLASGSLVGLLERLGYMPTSPGSWLSEEAWAVVWRQMRDALEEAGVDDLPAFARDLAGRVGRELGVAEGETELIGLGPEFAPRAAA